MNQIRSFLIEITVRQGPRPLRKLLLQVFSSPPEALSTRCGGQGVVIFFGMAKPVRAPQIGPARQL